MRRAQAQALSPRNDPSCRGVYWSRTKVHRQQFAEAGTCWWFPTMYFRQVTGTQLQAPNWCQILPADRDVSKTPPRRIALPAL